MSVNMEMFLKEFNPTSLFDGTCSCVYNNRILIGGCRNMYDGIRNLIRYSEPLEPMKGYNDNWVIVGDSEEEIKHIININKGLCIIKDKSIWLLCGKNPELLHENFYKTVNFSD